MIIHNVEEGQYAEDEETLEELMETRRKDDTVEKHYGIVQIVTDDYLSWNRLKDRLMLHPQEFDTQLRVNENALRNNPKSYQVWYHRTFMMERFPEQRERCLHREDLLTGVLLSLDPRNFHCWNYRMFLFGGESDTGHDLFNYSYLHHNPCRHDPLSVIYTDPLDDVGWEYLLVCREHRRLRNGVYVRRYPTLLEIRFKDCFNGELGLVACGVEKAVVQDMDTKIVVIGGTTEAFPDCTLMINGHETKLMHMAEDHGFIAEIRDLEPECRGALLALLDYTIDRTQRSTIVERLIGLDPCREKYYTSLVDEYYAVYSP